MHEYPDWATEMSATGFVVSSAVMMLEMKSLDALLENWLAVAVAAAVADLGEKKPMVKA